MSSEIKHITRDRPLTDEEAEKYRLIREQVKQNLPYLIVQDQQRSIMFEKNPLGDYRVLSKGSMIGWIIVRPQGIFWHPTFGSAMLTHFIVSRIAKVMDALANNPKNVPDTIEE